MEKKLFSKQLMMEYLIEASKTSMHYRTLLNDIQLATKKDQKKFWRFWESQDFRFTYQVLFFFKRLNDKDFLKLD